VVGAHRLDPLQLGVGAFERLYETADGWVCIVAFDAEQQAALGALAGVDVGLGTDSDDEVDHYAVGLRLAKALSARKTDELLDELILAGVPAAVPVGNQMSAFMRDPEQRRLGRVAEVHHPEKGAVRELAVLLRVSDTDTVPHRLAPALGEHTDALLHELGYDGGQIDALRARSAIR
jgi:crotonobetainyl-CoA:carnitine CoA-transferase CaiB-like acyl-CoA transferase